MEIITYRKTLDVHKNGTQFLLQGVQTADKLSRVVEVSLMASGDAIDFPLEGLVAFAYLFYPGADEPSYYKCEIVDNKVVCELPPITVEGITTVQIKLMETSTLKSQSVLASPEFAIEVSKSYANDDGEEMKTTFSGFEEFIMKAERAYAKRLERIELANDCMFYAYYADGSTYRTDILQKLFLNGNAILSESYAHGGTGTRIGEDTDNSMYYSNVSRSEALNAKNIMQNSKEVLDEVKKYGMYTAFSIDFTTGRLEYVSPSSDFKVNEETGQLEAVHQTYTFNEEVYEVVNMWLREKGVEIDQLKNHSERIENLEETAKLVSEHKEKLESINEDIEFLKTKDDWNIDDNIGVIGHAKHMLELPHYDDLGNRMDTASKTLHIINSGTIYVKIITHGSMSAGNTFEKAECVIDLNGNHVYTQSHSEDEVKASGTYDEHNKEACFSVKVKKGDKLTFTLDANYPVSLDIVSITLLANVETPYVYDQLFDFVDESFTIEDVLNALIGE